MISSIKKDLRVLLFLCLDKSRGSAERLRYLDDIFFGKINTLVSNRYNLERIVSEANLIIGATLVTGEKAAKVVTKDMVKRMKQFL